MADRPGSFKSSHNVSRRTIVMRRAKDEDARRLEEEEKEEASRRLAAAVSTRIIRKSTRTVGSRRQAETRRVVSGRSVVVRREGDVSERLSVSTRISGRGQASVRVTGGDTIIRYQSGDMVIKRGSRRARLRRQLIWGYAAGYLVLFGLYAYFLVSGTTTIEPMDFVEKAFSRRHSSAIADLELAALEAMRGNRTPAEVRLAQNLSFYDDNQDVVRVDAGDRLTLLTAAKLGRAILEDRQKEASRRNFAKPFVLYRETYLANLNWPFWLTVYNAIGFFLLLLLFLWRPLQNYLGTQGKKTAVALRNAHDAQAEAEDYRNRYRDLAAELDARGEQLRDEAESANEAERAAALKRAREQAQGIAGGIENALEAEERTRAGRLAAETAREACRRAMVILEKRLGQAEHDLAIDELIADIGGMRF